jgi:large subunit ribosomal protein L31
MREDIHPKYYPKAKVVCACGNTFTVGSTQELIEVEICSNCHPFYTGKEKMVDAMGRVEKFRKRLAKKQDSKKKKTSLVKPARQTGKAISGK